MDIFLIILGALCLAIGLVGCIVPALPGVPLAYTGLWLLHMTHLAQFSWQFLLIWGIVTIVVQILDYIVPIWGTKRFGGSKAGMWGCTIGIFIGLLIGPLGIIVGPFAGAVIGELITGKTTREALLSGVGSFIGFLAGTLVKLICCIVMIVYFIAELIN